VGAEIICDRVQEVNAAPLAQCANTRCPLWVKSGHDALML
jgi:hypothetical protein